MSALDWRPDLIRRELIIKKFQKEDFQSAALFMYPLDPIAINFDVYPISLFLSYANRCHPQHRAIGLRKESQSHPAGCRFRLRHETIRARPGQRQSQPRLPPRMDRCRPFEFSSFNSLFQHFSFYDFRRNQRTRRIRSGIRSTGSFPRGANQLVRFPLPTGIHPGSSHIGFLPSGQELRPRYLHRSGNI